MLALDTWWSPAAQCWRVEDGEMFTYYELAQVIGHFHSRPRPAIAQMAIPKSDRGIQLRDALLAAGISIVYNAALD